MDFLKGLKLNTAESTRVEIKLPTGIVLKDLDGKVAYIDVMSSDSQKANELRTAIRNARNVQDGPVSQEQRDADNVAVLAGLTTGWYLVGFDRKPITGNDGITPLPFSIENAKVLYAEPAADWITEQPRIATGDRARFMPAPASA